MFLQFTRVVNVFYFFNAILQSIPAISTNKPTATIIPLTFVIIVGIIKELIVEVKRWLDDREINRKVYRKLVPLDERKDLPEPAEGEPTEYRFKDVYLADIKVGDILEIRDNEALPADCVLLKAKDLNG